MTFQGRAPLLCSLLPKGIVAFTAPGAALAILAEAFGGMERSCSRYSRRRSSPLLSAYEGQRCISFVCLRGKLGFEAFDSEERSLRVYATQREAAAAIMRRSP
jgi:hypothetical protein